MIENEPLDPYHAHRPLVTDEEAEHELANDPRISAVDDYTRSDMSSPLQDPAYGFHQYESLSEQEETQYDSLADMGQFEEGYQGIKRGHFHNSWYLQRILEHDAQQSQGTEEDASDQNSAATRSDEEANSRDGEQENRRDSPAVRRSASFGARR